MVSAYPLRETTKPGLLIRRGNIHAPSVGPLAASVVEDNRSSGSRRVILKGLN